MKLNLGQLLNDKAIDFNVETTRNDYLEAMAYLRSAMVSVSGDKSTWDVLDKAHTTLLHKLGEVSQAERDHGFRTELDVMGVAMIRGGANPEAVTALLTMLDPDNVRQQIEEIESGEVV